MKKLLCLFLLCANCFAAAGPIRDWRDFQEALNAAAGDVVRANGTGGCAYVALSGIAVTSATGTANQVLVNGTTGAATTGAITLTTPQSIGTGSSPSFNRIFLSSYLSLLDTAGDNQIHLVTTSDEVSNRDVKLPALGADKTLACVVDTGGLVSVASEITGVLPLANGGTAKALTASAGGIVWTDSDSQEVLAGTGTASKLLLSGASATPSWSTPTHPTAATLNKVIVGDGTNWVLPTPTIPLNASPGSGKVLIGDGTNYVLTTPTYPNAASPAAGKILRADGTNWVASTPTYTATATLNTMIIGDGTNFITATPTLARNLAGTIPVVVATSNLTAQGSAIAATTIYAVPASQGGFYRVNWHATVTRAATTSCTLGGATGFQLKYTDLNDSVVKTQNPTAITWMTSSINATGTAVSGSFCAYCAASTNLQYIFGYTSSGGTAMQYDLSITVESL